MTTLDSTKLKRILSMAGIDNSTLTTNDLAAFKAVWVAAQAEQKLEDGLALVCKEAAFVDARGQSYFDTIKMQRPS